MKPLPFPQNKDYKSCCGVKANPNICVPHSAQKQRNSLSFCGDQFLELSPSFSWCFPRDEAFFFGDEVLHLTNSRACTSVHHRTKKCSGKCTSCILNILHFLLSFPFPLPGVSQLSVSLVLQQCPSSSFFFLIYNPKSSGKGCRGQAFPNKF